MKQKMNFLEDGSPVKHGVGSVMDLVCVWTLTNNYCNNKFCGFVRKPRRLCQMDQSLLFQSSDEFSYMPKKKRRNLSEKTNQTGPEREKPSFKSLHR